MEKMQKSILQAQRSFQFLFLLMTWWLRAQALLRLGLKTWLSPLLML